LALIINGPFAYFGVLSAVFGLALMQCIREFSNKIYYKLGREKVILICGFSSLLIFVGEILALRMLGIHLTGTLACCMLAAAVGIPAFLSLTSLWLSLMAGVSVGATGRVKISELWVRGRWLAISAVMRWVNNQAITYAAFVLVGPESVAKIFAVRQAFSPFFFAFSNG
jgi:hypothetical protein